jgi:hypothetical protein
MTVRLWPRSVREMDSHLPRVAFRHTITGHQKATRWRILRESLHHAQARASARSCHQQLVLFLTTTRVMKVRRSLGNTVAKHYRECQLRSKSPKIVMSLVDRQANWPVQENNYDYFYEDQGGDATENHTPARRRRHRYVQFGIFGRRCRTSLYASIELRKTPAMSQKQKWLESSRGNLSGRI